MLSAVLLLLASLLSHPLWDEQQLIVGRWLVVEGQVIVKQVIVKEQVIVKKQMIVKKQVIVKTQVIVKMQVIEKESMTWVLLKEKKEPILEEQHRAKS